VRLNVRVAPECSGFASETSDFVSAVFAFEVVSTRCLAASCRLAEIAHEMAVAASSSSIAPAA